MLRHTHSDRLERWLGSDNVAHLSQSMRDWYGPPIAIGGVPGNVYAARGGDFIGEIRVGWEATWQDYARDFMRQIRRGIAVASSPHHATLHGLTSLADVIAEATAGKMRTFNFSKVGNTGVTSATMSMWGYGGQPGAGANASNAPGGDAPTDATTGAFLFANPANPDTQHFVSGFPLASVAGNSLLLYDRIFQVNKTMNSTATEAVTGVPTRYQNTTSGNPDSADGNFLFVEVGGTALAATAHNWTVCLYTDQNGNGASTLPSLTGNSGAIARRLDHPLQQWFAPLADGDSGIKQLDQMQCSAAVVTGVINFVIGHPIAWLPCPLLNAICPMDGIMTAFQLQRIFDDAALAFLEVSKPSSTATNYTGTFNTVSG